MIRIRSKRDGFRRCGISHPKEPTDYSDDRFTEAEMNTLTAEDMLIVENIEGDKKPKGTVPDLPAEQGEAAESGLPRDAIKTRGKK